MSAPKFENKEYLAKQKAREAKRLIRSRISQEVGDTEAILGTTADVTQLNAAAILALVVSLEKAKNFDDFRAYYMANIEALVPAQEGKPNVYQLAEGFLRKVQNGEIILTASMKGLGKVVEEMATRSTGVAQVLIQAMRQGV